jgi:hypothetical protein
MTAENCYQAERTYNSFLHSLTFSSFHGTTYSPLHLSKRFATACGTRASLPTGPLLAGDDLLASTVVLTVPPQELWSRPCGSSAGSRASARRTAHRQPDSHWQAVPATLRAGIQRWSCPLAKHAFPPERANWTHGPRGFSAPAPALSFLSAMTCLPDCPFPLVILFATRTAVTRPLLSDEPLLAQPDTRPNRRQSRVPGQSTQF